MLIRKENKIYRVVKEDKGKELNNLQELVDYLKDDYHFVYDTDIVDNSWSDMIDTGGRCSLYVDAHTDEKGNTYFGSPSLKAGYFDDMNYKEWARSILRGNKNKEISDDEIDEMVSEALDNFINDSDTYVDYFSKDLKLPCDKKDVDAVISKEKDILEKIIYRAEEKLFNAIKKSL